MPLLWVTGSNDFAYPLSALQLSYRLPAGERWLAIRLRMPHAHGGAGEKPEEIRVFADSILKGGQPLARVGGFWREGAEVSVDYTAQVPIVAAELNYTRAEGRWQDRLWESVPAEIRAGRASAVLPEGARVYYFNLFDERGCVVSTEHERLPHQAP